MKVYLLSVGVGLLVGVIYGLVQVRSPAPPVIALVGLLGILVGEQIPPFIKSMVRNESVGHSWRQQVHPHMFGHMPKGHANAVAQATQDTTVGLGAEHHE